MTPKPTDRKEAIEKMDKKCITCNGTGRILTDDFHGQITFEPCPQRNGTGIKTKKRGDER